MACNVRAECNTTWALLQGSLSCYRTCVTKFDTRGYDHYFIVMRPFFTGIRRLERKYFTRKWFSTRSKAFYFVRLIVLKDSCSQINMRKLKIYSLGRFEVRNHKRFYAISKSSKDGPIRAVVMKTEMLEPLRTLV